MGKVMNSQMIDVQLFFFIVVQPPCEIDAFADHPHYRGGVNEVAMLGSERAEVTLGEGCSQ